MNKANTSLEVLISCFIISVALILVLPFQKTLQKHINHNHVAKNLAYYKIQMILAQSKIVGVSADEVRLVYLGEETSIVFDRNRLVKKPGYHILIQNINGYFYLEKECIYLNEDILYCKKGLR